MVAILGNLDSSLYKPGDIILEQSTKVENLIMVSKGKCNLYGFFPDQTKVMVVGLSERSWYGDYQIMLNLESSFQLEAGSLNHNDQFVNVFKVKKELIIDLCTEYPLFRRFLMLRATQRRSYFVKVL